MSIKDMPSITFPSTYEQSIKPVLIKKGGNEMSKEIEALENLNEWAIEGIKKYSNLDLISKIKIDYNIIKQVLTRLTPKIKEVYILMSSGGGISLDFSGKGTVYSSLEKGLEALQSKNEWSKTKGYGTFELVPLKVQESESE